MCWHWAGGTVKHWIHLHMITLLALNVIWGGGAVPLVVSNLDGYV